MEEVYILINRFDEKAYLDYLQDNGIALNVIAVENEKDIPKDVKILSTNPKLKTNYFKTIEEALKSINIDLIEISENELTDRTLKVLIA